MNTAAHPNIRFQRSSAGAQVQKEEPPPLTCPAHRNAGSDYITIRGLIHRR